VRLAAHEKRHRLPFFQSCFEALLSLVDSDLQAAAAPVKAEAKAASTRRQLWIDGHAVALQ
jgi:hypothetical protein